MSDQLEPVAPDMDSRPRQLLDRYVSLVGGMVMDVSPLVVQVELPAAEQRRFGKGERLTFALAPAGLEEAPEAEVLALGSGALNRLVDAIRDRGGYDRRGMIPSAVEPTADAAALTTPMEGATAGPATVDLASLPVGRLLARVSINSGSSVVERLVESSVVDLSIGSTVARALAEACELADPSAVQAALPDGVRIIEARPMSELLPVLFADLEVRLAGDLSRIATDASIAAATELSRLDAYYARRMAQVDLEDTSEDVDDRKAAIKAEQTRRAEEERFRAKVKVTIHPVQLIEWRVLAQRAEWRLETPGGATGMAAATRMLAGDTAWTLKCAACGAVPSVLRVCQAGHSACPSCSERCGVCGDSACASHGLANCAVEGHPVCVSHSAVCASCRQPHCTTHSARCASRGHDICTSCALTCARCGAAVCRAHSVETAPEAPLGQRWLCGDCTTCCEGGSNEQVGLDEVERCSSCERLTCRRHATECAVDGLIHCSRHLRKSDHSGRLSCESHRAACADEPNSVFASDEVQACATCGRAVCDTHGGVCVVDELRHCVPHLLPLKDQPGQRACETHRNVCAVDGQAFSLTGTKGCPVCAKQACDAHLKTCSSCSRSVCASDVEGGMCRTCRRLEPITDPADELIAAAIVANKGEPPKAKAWRAARDARDTVVELDLGWKRRLVFAVTHGESRPVTAVYYSLFGTERRR